MSEALNLEQVIALGGLHATLEAEGDLLGVMDTLSNDPVYIYPSLGKKFSGRANSQRFYEYFFEHFSPFVKDAKLINEWANLEGVAQEYEMVLNLDGEDEHLRILGVLVVEGDKLGGETVYASEYLIKRMIGPLFDELEDM